MGTLTSFTWLIRIIIVYMHTYVWSFVKFADLCYEVLYSVMIILCAKHINEDEGFDRFEGHKCAHRTGIPTLRHFPNVYIQLTQFVT